MKPKTRVHNREVLDLEEAEAEFTQEEEIDPKNGGMRNFYCLPEGCVANIISLTSPRDACRSSAVSSVFKSAAESDIVWERFLPSDYEDIISRSSSGSRSSSSGHHLNRFSSKKELYFYLCEHPILIDGGTKSFRVHKSSGKKIYMIGAKELSIVWGGTPQYWRWTSLPEARFPEVAELIRVCWLEIKGKMDTRILSPETAYTANLVMKSVKGAYGFEHPPAEASVKVTSTTDITTINTDDGVDWWMANDQGGRSVYLDRACAMRRHFQLAPAAVAPHAVRNKELASYGHGRPTLLTRWDIAGLVQFPWSRGDGWMEVEMGEFYNVGGDQREVQMSLTEIKGGHWKAGLIVQGIELRPKNK